ncbi:MAG: hypothetical protein KIT31_22710 [Deltaproteobacteria bacterium]|nr:hypothetical protein [Deltaproteobacteria bacterium]
MNRFAIAFVLSMLAGCQSQKATNGDSTASGGGRPGALGKERSDCRPDKTCDPGLLCLSNLCVRPPPADCAAVGEQLASLDLGNYAPVEERQPVVAKYQAQCEKVYVTKEQGQCLDKVRDRWMAGQCAPDLFPDLAAHKDGACGQLTDKMTSAMLRVQGRYFEANPQMKKNLDASMKAYLQSCTEDQWPDALKKCVLGADLGSHAYPQGMPPACNGQMVPELLQKLQQRISLAVQEAQRG